MANIASFRARQWRLLPLCLLLLWCGGLCSVAAQTRPPIIITDAASTRALALDALSRVRDPLPTNTLAFTAGADTRTRVLFFVLNLDLLPGEGVSALSVDGEDSTHRFYKFKVEDVRPVPGFEGLQQIIVRLSDDIGDVGDVLLRLNLHGVASNRVRISVGHTGGTIADDAGSAPSPAPNVPPAPTPTPTPNAYTGAASDADTVRFLEQTTWGPTPAEVARVKVIGFNAYLNEQFNLAASSYPTLPLMPTDTGTGCPQTDQTQRTVCQRDNYSMYPLQLKLFTNAMYGPDQLRQRVAFALHKIIVVSGRDTQQPSWMASYLQAIDRDAFGNFRQLLQDITLNPTMGEYLDMRGNTKTAPNENYAREILQLFSVGLDQLSPDGTPVLDAQGNRIPTYDQTTITTFARVFTGWNLAAAKTTVINGTPLQVPNYQDPMVVANENNHDKNPKVLLQYNGAISGLPGGQVSAQDLSAALDNIFNHPNVGPFIGKALIQQLVTSNPSPAYVARITAVFNNNGQGVRGDLKAVVRAILLDPEARGDAKTDPNYGRLREPIQLITNMLRAYDAKSFDRAANSDGYLSPNAVTLDEDPLRPPTVFSYFPADYNVPGTDLTGPEFGILSATTSLRRANFISTILYVGIARSADTVNGNAPQGTKIDVAAMQALAGNPQQLVSALNAQLMHGTMSAAMNASIVQALASVTDPLKRTRMAIYLVATSSQYQVER